MRESIKHTQLSKNCLCLKISRKYVCYVVAVLAYIC